MNFENYENGQMSFNNMNHEDLVRINLSKSPLIIFSYDFSSKRYEKVFLEKLVL